ncbi:MAG: phosphohydrolase [Candidatus Doudnabacteria bacterium CG10_big_fil_rev_8_21_14_0_10_41_10]|uniref:5'-deoxynucleotidase n=1 Tax=Candidatus Doudnabacteria bacterium CG10_big_fil_rev_8_21_14_0_10_41_10 TaxID=1974551 RepID=A0A2H0VFT1_9BACT|nr:MAG: phosphohydrolase [Candidatus Doudnabacteria bacterium CG10_big_fil_rev_8_21_14_0_10_41_10]
MKNLKNIVNFLFETGILAKTPRSGFHFLGSGKQSVAEHTNRASFIGYALSMMEKNADTAKVLKMCLLHDLAEARTTDLNYLHQKYTVAKEEKAVEDLSKTLPFGEDIKNTIKEYQERITLEAKLAKDADNLEWALSMKEQWDIGNVRAKDWFEITVKRLITDTGKRLAEEIRKTDSNDWFFPNKNDDWWVNRNKKK